MENTTFASIATESEIREMIAESGKTKVKEMVQYVEMRIKRLNKDFDLKMLQKNAKELAKEMKAYM